MDVIQDAPAVRGRRFSGESMQRSVPSLPCPWAKARGTAKRWRWVMKNWRLIVKAFRKTWYKTHRHFTNQDIVNFLAPTVFKAMRTWRKGGGYKLGNYVWVAVRNALNAARNALFAAPAHPGVGGMYLPPLLLGDYRPDPSGEFEHDTEPPGDLLDLVGEAWQSLDARRRMAVSLWLGMDGERRTFADIGSVLGVSKERVSQLVETAVVRLRKTMGLQCVRPAMASTGSWGRRTKAEYAKASNERAKFRKRRRELLDAGAADSL